MKRDLGVDHNDPPERVFFKAVGSAFIRAYDIKNNAENIEKHEDIYFRKGENEKEYRMYKSAGKKCHLIFKFAVDFKIEQIYLH